MPWLETNVYEQRIQFVVEALQPTATLTALCHRYEISRKTGYKWLARYRAAGSLTALTNHSRRPGRSPAVTAEPITARVIALRRRYGWAGRKLQPLLAAEGLPVSTATIDRIIRREGLTDRDEAHRPALHRFTRARPNELWQMDFKGQYPLRRARWCFPLSLVDDHSRYAIGVFALRGTASAGVHDVLVQCFERYGVPDALLVDHGVPWWGPANGHGLTTVVVALLKQGIDVVYSGVRHPQTQGKVERFHRTLGRRLRQWGLPTTLAGFAAAFDRFCHEYNEVRPHEALALQPPSTAAIPGVAAPTSRYPPHGSIRRPGRSNGSIAPARSRMGGAAISSVRR